MVANSDQPPLPARRLAERLRYLREREHESLTQRQLAVAIGGAEPLSVATISQWENPGSGRLPPPQRLAAYARLFCTSRSFTSGEPRLLSEDELTEQELGQEAELHAELLRLREQAQQTVAAAPGHSATGPYTSFWHLADGAAVSIVCSDAPNPPDYAKPSHLNYSRYARYADLDALIEVFGQVRADNPASMIRILPTQSLEYDFALNHLIIIGGAAGRDTALWFARGIALPKTKPIPGTETYLFTCQVGDETREFESVLDDDGDLFQDVGLIARGPHPNIPHRTVTVLGGITSRGVHGAALCFTDAHIRDINEKYLTDTFGETNGFCILMRVPVRNGAALPSNLSDPGIRLYEWSARTGAHW
jgi:transcriptional regulator with XRE-family HTH domain